MHWKRSSGWRSHRLRRSEKRRLRGRRPVTRPFLMDLPVGQIEWWTAISRTGLQNVQIFLAVSLSQGILVSLWRLPYLNNQEETANSRVFLEGSESKGSHGCCIPPNRLSKLARFWGRYMKSTAPQWMCKLGKQGFFRICGGIGHFLENFRHRGDAFRSTLA